MDTVACSDLAGTFIDFFFSCYVRKVAYWFLGNNSSFGDFIVVFKYVKEVRKVLWLLSSEIDVVKCSATKHLWLSSQGQKQD